MFILASTSVSSEEEEQEESEEEEEGGATMRLAFAAIVYAKLWRFLAIRHREFSSPLLLMRCDAMR